MNINKIAAKADALRNKDATKAICFNLVKWAASHEGVMVEEDLARLYRYFMPTSPAKPKTDWSWVALAAGKKDVRFYLNYIYSDGKRLMATDGSRLHLVKTDKYEPGYYDRAGTKIHDIDWHTYPNVDRVIPNEELLDAKVAFSELEMSVTPKASAPYDHVYYFGDTCVCSAYLKEAVLGFNHNTIEYKDHDNGLAVMIHDDNKIAIVMPIRTK